MSSFESQQAAILSLFTECQCITVDDVDYIDLLKEMLIEDGGVELTLV